MSLQKRIRFGESWLHCREPFSTLSEAVARVSVSPVHDRDIRGQLDVLRIEHRDLDEAIAALGAAGVPDQLRLARLKKRKLRLRDEIAMLESRLIPDIIA